MNTKSLSTLCSVALGVALTGTSGLYAMRWSIQSKVRQSVTYAEALQCLKDNENAVDVLGAPIKDMNVDVGDDNCYGRKDNVMWVTVPLKGTKRMGRLHYWVNVFDSKNNKFRLSRVELTIDGTTVGPILLRADSADSETEVPAA